MDFAGKPRFSRWNRHMCHFGQILTLGKTPHLRLVKSLLLLVKSNRHHWHSRPASATFRFSKALAEDAERKKASRKISRRAWKPMQLQMVIASAENPWWRRIWWKILKGKWYIYIYCNIYKAWKPFGKSPTKWLSLEFPVQRFFIHSPIDETWWNGV